MKQTAERVSVNKIRVFHAMLAKANLMTQKSAILSSYDVQSTKQLSDKQIDELIDWLNGQINGNTLNDHDWLMFDARSSQHLYILSLCHQIGWVKHDESRGRYIADMASMATWLKTKSRHKIPILKQSRAQLQDTIYQLEKVLESI